MNTLTQSLTNKTYKEVTMKLETAIEALKFRGYGTEKDEQFYQDCIKTIEENVEELFGEIKELKDAVWDYRKKNDN